MIASLIAQCSQTEFGSGNQDIADILGTTKGTVEVLKSRVGKSKKIVMEKKVIQLLEDIKKLPL